MEVGIGSSTISFVRCGRQRSVLCTDPQSWNLCDHFWPLTFVIHSSVFDHRQFCIWHIWPFIGRFCTFGSQISLIVLSQVNKVGDKRSAHIESYAEFFNLPRILHIHVYTHTHTHKKLTWDVGYNNLESSIAEINPELCPPECPRPCVRVCPAAAIAFNNTMAEEQTVCNSIADTHQSSGYSPVQQMVGPWFWRWALSCSSKNNRLSGTHIYILIRGFNP